MTHFALSPFSLSECRVVVSLICSVHFFHTCGNNSPFSIRKAMPLSVRQPVRTIIFIRRLLADLRSVFERKAFFWTKKLDRKREMWWKKEQRYENGQFWKWPMRAEIVRSEMVKARSVRRKGVSNSLQATITADYPQIWLIFDSQVNSDFLVTIIKSTVAKVLAVSLSKSILEEPAWF